MAIMPPEVDGPTPVDLQQLAAELRGAAHRAMPFEMLEVIQHATVRMEDAARRWPRNLDDVKEHYTLARELLQHCREQFPPARPRRRAISDEEETD